MADFSERSRTGYNEKADGYDNSREGQFTRRIHQLLLPMLNRQSTDCNDAEKLNEGDLAVKP